MSTVERAVAPSFELPQGDGVADSQWQRVEHPSQLMTGDDIAVTIEVVNPPSRCDPERLAEIGRAIVGTVTEPIPDYGEQCGREMWLGALHVATKDGNRMVSIGRALANMGITRGVRTFGYGDDHYVETNKQVWVRRTGPETDVQAVADIRPLAA